MSESSVQDFVRTHCRRCIRANLISLAPRDEPSAVIRRSCNIGFLPPDAATRQSSVSVNSHAARPQRVAGSTRISGPDPEVRIRASAKAQSIAGKGFPAGLESQRGSRGGSSIISAKYSPSSDHSPSLRRSIRGTGQLERDFLQVARGGFVGFGGFDDQLAHFGRPSEGHLVDQVMRILAGRS
jgi:hypothetical protein